MRRLRRLKPLLLRLWRASVLVTLAWLVHHEHTWLEAQRSGGVTLAQAQRLLPAAHRLSPRDVERGGHYVFDAIDQPLGYVLTTSPATHDIIGYSGPSNVLVALDTAGAVVAAEILDSGDTTDHVRLVQQDKAWLHAFRGWKPADQPLPKVAAVSGATLTSSAIAESIARRLAGNAPSLRFPDPLTLEEVRELFPAAVRFEPDDAQAARAASGPALQAAWRVLGDDGQLLGFAVRSSPWSDNVSGYRGPTESLIALRPDGRTVAALRLRKSYDTPDYVKTVKDDDHWMQETFVGKTTDWLAAMDYQRDGIEGVSGATETSWAMAEGLKRRFAAAKPEPTSPWQFRWRDWALVGVVLGGVVMAFTNLRGNKWLRRGWQALLIGYVGLASGDLLSLGLFAGWTEHGLAWRVLPGLVVMLAAALIVPWTSRRQLYCHQLCPHGAAQQWLGAITKRKWQVPQRLERWLAAAPFSLLAVALVVVMRGWPLDLANLEPFDAWSWRAAGMATIAIAVVGLAVSIRIPQAYCRYGCPTGALLELVRSHGAADRFSRRDWFAVALLLIALVARPSWALPHAQPAQQARQSQPAPGEQAEFRGRAMGTTWCVKLDRPAPVSLQADLEACLEEIENLASNWRPNSAVSRFNALQSTEAAPVPADLVGLVEQSRQISQATDGAFDVTVAPLVKLWGFGPGGHYGQAPSVDTVNAARQLVGWRKLQITAAGALQKEVPALTLDLSSIAEGWAVDRMCAVLERQGHRQYLVEAGGELKARGSWTVAVERPLRVVRLTDSALSTSGTYRQNWNDQGRQRSHIIDPRTAEPVTHDTVSVTVIHADCAAADAWSTALLVLGADEGLQVAEREGLAAAFVIERNEACEIRFSTAWRQDAAPAEISPSE